MKGAYYNEIDPYAAQWLRNLIAAGHIASGDVDERDIRPVQPAELAGYTQCHFFAGIGVWSYALRLAGWPDERPAWSGSCPCQPFSTAGQGKGHEDERHLWPTWFWLIRESRPDVCFGEQVADGDGEAWLDHVGYDLESIGYAIGALSPAACGFGAPHERQRLYFVADADELRGGRHPGAFRGEEGEPRLREVPDGAEPGGAARGLEYAYVAQQDERAPGGQQPLRDERGASCGLGNACGEGCPEQRREWDESARSPTAGFWRDADWIYCRGFGDIAPGYRPVEPGAFPLAHGVAARMDKVRAYGNAIVAPVAAEFIRAYMSPHISPRRT